MSVRCLSLCRVCAVALLWREGSIASVWLLLGAGTEEIAARWPARPHQGEGQFPQCGALRLPIHPGSAGPGGPWLLLATLQGAGQFWGLHRGANWEPPQPLSSCHRQPMCAKGCPSTVCPKCALCVYIYILIYGAYHRLNASAASLRLGGVPWSFAVPCLCRCRRGLCGISLGIL